VFDVLLRGIHGGRRGGIHRGFRGGRHGGIRGGFRGGIRVIIIAEYKV